MKLRSFSLWAVPGLCLALLACGGGGGGGGGTTVNQQSVTFTVFGVGPIKGATVCLDTNLNGDCADDVNSQTDDSGKVTLVVPSDQVGKYPALAVVNENINGIGNNIRYVFAAPAASSALISPLTTIVQQLVASGIPLNQAAQLVQSKSGVSVSTLLNNYLSPNDSNARVLARAVTLVMARSWNAVSSLAPLTGSTKPVDLDKVLRTQVLQNFQDIVTAVTGLSKDPACSGSNSPASSSCDSLIIGKLNDNKVDKNQDGTWRINPSNAPIVVAVNNTLAADVPGYGAPVVVTANSPMEFSLKWLTYTDASHWYYKGHLSDPNYSNAEKSGKSYRTITNEQTAPGAIVVGGGMVGAAGDSSVDRLFSNTLYWNSNNGTWQSCSKTTASSVSGRDPVTGLHTFSYCDGYQQGLESVTEVDYTGKTVLQMVQDIRNYPAPAFYGYADWGTGALAALKAQTSPSYTFVSADGAKLRYVTVTATAYAPQFDNTSDNVMPLITDALVAGGPKTAACLAADSAGIDLSQDVTRLEDLISHSPGTPCSYDPVSYRGVGGALLSSNDGSSYNGTRNTGRNEWWSATTIELGGTDPDNLSAVAQAQSQSFYTGYYKFRVGFPNGTADPKVAQFYACLQRADILRATNCDPIGAYPYAITTYVDGSRVLSFNGLPFELAYLKNTPIFVERAGKVYAGLVTKPWQYSDVRPNYGATKQLLNALQIPFPPRQQ